MSAGLPLLIAAACLGAGTTFAPRHARCWLALTVCGATSALGAALLVLLGGADWEWRGGFAVGHEPLHLRLDGLSALFLALLCVVGGAGAVYAREYWSDRAYPTSAGRGRALWSALVASMGFVLVASNGLHFLVAWELFAISSYFLITLDRKRPEVRAAGWLFLAASHAGTLCLFAFFADLAERSGSWDLGPMLDGAVSPAWFWLALAGFGLKAGFFPLHVWLPAAHASAPSHVSAILSGVAIKMGLYGILRFSGWLPLPPAAGGVVIGLGATSALVGIAFALAQNDLKRLLAYCSVENMGVMLIGVGAAMLAATHGDAAWGRLALAGALLHVWNHGAFKALLFLGAGSVLHATGTREMSRLGGLWRRMPWTAGVFVLGSLAASGLPPLNGFVGEWLVYLGLFDAASGKGPSSWAAIPAAILLALAGALALASFTKAAAVVFLGAPRTTVAAAAHECGPWMRGPMLALAAACVTIGLAPVLVWPALSRAVGAWRPAWRSVAPPAPLLALGLVHLGLVGAAGTAAVVLQRRARARGLRGGLTWDCGYVAPTVRMQYTSGSFAEIATGWFAWILRPSRDLRRPRGLAPQRALAVARVPETVLERWIAPAGGAILRLSTAVRRLQHGRVQSYLVYLVAGLAVLGLIVLVGRAA